MWIELEYAIGKKTSLIFMNVPMFLVFVFSISGG